MSRDLREQLVQLTYRDDEPRVATCAEHLVRAIDSIDLATREQPTDSTDARRGLMRSRLHCLELAQEILAVLEAERRRAAK